MIENRPTPEQVLKCLQHEIQNSSGPCDAGTVMRHGSFVGSVIESHASLPRAMDYSRNLIRSSIEAGGAVTGGTVILADTMTKSKGRFTRSWHAPRGGVWGCMIHKNTLLPQSRGFIPLVVGVSCCEMMRAFGLSDASVRWVNDVLVGGKKLGGFLVECYTVPGHDEEYTLVGFGINVNNSSFPSELSDTAGSMSEIFEKECDLTAITTDFLARLAVNFGLLYHEEGRELRGAPFSGDGGRHLLLDKWLDLSDTIGQKVIYGFDVMTAPQYRAQVAGIDESGGLILHLEDGSKKIECSGEVRYL